MNFLPRHWLLAIASFLFLPLGLYAPRGLAPLFVLTAVLLISSILISRRSLKLTSRYIYLVAMALPIFGAVTAIWSPTPEVSIKTSIVLGGTIFFGFLVINNSTLNQSFRAYPFEIYLIVGGVIGFLLLFIENITNGGLIRIFYQLFGLEESRLSFNDEGPFIFNPGLSVASLYIWPLGMILFRHFDRLPAILLVFLFSLGIFIGPSSAPIVALLVGLITMLITRILPRLGPNLLILATALYTITAPAMTKVFPNPFDPDSKFTQFYALSHIHRYMIWDTTFIHIKNKPILGHGLDVSRSMYSKNDRITSEISIKGKSKKEKIFAEPIPLHPHNAILQIWLELGFVGAVLLASFFVGLLHLLKNISQNRWETAACYGVFASGLTISSLSYGIWQSWWLCGLILTGVFVTTVSRNSQMHNELNQN